MSAGLQLRRAGLFCTHHMLSPPTHPPRAPTKYTLARMITSSCFGRQERALRHSNNARRLRLLWDNQLSDLSSAVSATGKSASN